MPNKRGFQRDTASRHHATCTGFVRGTNRGQEGHRPTHPPTHRAETLGQTSQTRLPFGTKRHKGWNEVREDRDPSSTVLRQTKVSKYTQEKKKKRDREKSKVAATRKGLFIEVTESLQCRCSVLLLISCCLPSRQERHLPSPGVRRPGPTDVGPAPTSCPPEPQGRRDSDTDPRPSPSVEVPLHPLRPPYATPLLLPRPEARGQCLTWGFSSGSTVALPTTTTSATVSRPPTSSTDGGRRSSRTSRSPSHLFVLDERQINRRVGPEDFPVRWRRSEWTLLSGVTSVTCSCTWNPVRRSQV